MTIRSTSTGMAGVVATSMLAALALHSAPASAEGIAWNTIRNPTQEAPNVVGGYSNGCIDGALAMPPEGAGYQVVWLNRNQNYGHPELIRYLTDLGSQVEQAGIGSMLIADMSQPRGGPIPGHVSHQSGLDADIWYRLDLPPTSRADRDNALARRMVDRSDWSLNENAWTDGHAELVRLAASDPRVARIFIHPTLKRDICERDWAERDWMRVLRPWFGHDAHFHGRLHCPDESQTCVPQSAPPPGDGCGEELLSWFPEPGEPPPQPPSGRRTIPTPSAACVAIANK